MGAATLNRTARRLVYLPSAWPQSVIARSPGEVDMDGILDRKHAGALFPDRAVVLTDLAAGMPRDLAAGQMRRLAGVPTCLAGERTTPRRLMPPLWESARGEAPDERKICWIRHGS
jgi:hypothetical protein